MKTLPALLNLIYISMFIVFTLVLMGCDNSENPKQIDMSLRSSHSPLLATTHRLPDMEPHYHFAFNLRSSPQEDAKQYISFLNYLEKATGYHFELSLTSKDQQIDQQLGLGLVHFAAIGAVTHVRAQQHYSVTSLARGLNSHNMAEYQSVVVVKPDSPIENLEQLKGKRLAFGNVESTQGHLIPRIELLEKGINLQDFSEYTYTGSHQDCANTVITGKYDACAMQDTMGNSLVQQGLVKIIHRSSYYPSSGISANKDVPPEVIDVVRQALLDFKPNGEHAEGLYEWGETEMPNGFTSANDDDYIQLKKWMIRLGMLDKTGVDK